MVGRLFPVETEIAVRKHSPDMLTFMQSGQDLNFTFHIKIHIQ